MQPLVSVILTIKAVTVSEFKVMEYFMTNMSISF